jgi:NADH dehydrogenase
MPGSSGRASKQAYGRLRELGVRVNLSARISEVDGHFVKLMSGEKIAYDVLLWTAGIKARNSLLKEVQPDKKGRLPVNELFQVEGFHNIFALGDMACVKDSKGNAAPCSAQDAQGQAKYLVYVLPYAIKNQKSPLPYKNAGHGFIVNIGGKWAILNDSGIYLTGWLAYFADKLAHLRYYASLVGFYKALKCVIFQMEIYGRND